MIGCALNLGAQVFWFTHLQVHPAYVSQLLPAQLLGGAGVGLAIPSLLGAGSASLPPERFGTGSGILNMGRQIGTVVGVAGLIAVLSHVSPGNPLAAFRHSVILGMSFFGSAFLVSAGLLSARTSTAAVPDRVLTPANLAVSSDPGRTQ
jgi:hypothetical protein